MITKTLRKKAQRTLILLALGASSWLGCTDPELSSGKEIGQQCVERHECRIGAVCSSEDSVCVESYTNKNGVFTDKIVIGSTLPLTGGLQDLGKSMLVGMQAYIHHINTTKGGVHGRKIELVAYDDAYEVARAKQNAEKMIKGANREVFATLGNMGSPTAEVTVPLHNDNKVVFFAPYTGAAVTRKDPPDRYIFNLRASYADEAKTLTNYLLQGREPAVAPTNIGIFAQATPGSNSSSWERLDAYGKEGFIGAADALKAFDGTEKSDIFLSSYERGTASVDQATEQLLRWMASPDRATDRGGNAITIGLVMQSVANASTQLITSIKDELNAIKTQGLSTVNLTAEELDRLKRVNLIITLTSPVGDKLAADLKLLQSSSKNYCEGLIISQVVPPISSASSGVTKYKEQLSAFDANEIPGFVSFEGYLAARLFVEALEAAGPELTDELFVETIESLKDVDLGIGALANFGPSNHQASDKVWGTALTQDCRNVEFGLE